MNLEKQERLIAILCIAACVAWAVPARSLLELVTNGSVSGLHLLVLIAAIASLLTAALRLLRGRSRGRRAFVLALALFAVVYFWMPYIIAPIRMLSLAAAAFGLANALRRPPAERPGENGVP